MKNKTIHSLTEAGSFASSTSQRTAPLSTPLTYYGAKQKLAVSLLPMIPKHQMYVECFGGGAAEPLFRKPPSKVEIYNDVDGNVVNFFEVLRGERGDELIRKLQLTPHARAEHARCKRRINDIDEPVEKARCYFVCVRQSYSQLFNNSYSTSGAFQAIAKTWRNEIDNTLPAAINRLRSVQIENLDFRKLIPKYDKPNTFFYLDPPYPHWTRTAAHKGRSYVHEMTKDDHNELLDMILGVEGKVMLSGYANSLYDRRLKRWRRWTKVVQSFSATGVAKGRRCTTRQEIVWMNYRL